MNRDPGWVTVATYPFAGDAEVARSALASAGIETTLLDANAGGMLAHITIATGGIRLQVRADQVIEAREILGETKAIDDEALAIEAGAAPGEDAQASPRSGRRVAMLLIALFGLSVLALLARVLTRMLAG